MAEQRDGVGGPRGGSPSGAPRRPTISDVAARAGVSKGAVSFALNGSPGVSEQTRQRILAASRELGWRPNRAARSLSRSRSEAIGMVLNRPMRTLGVEPFFAQFSSGLTVELASHGLSLHTFIVSSLADELATYERWWVEQRVDGIVILDPTVDDARLQRLIELELPTVVIGELPRQLQGAGAAGCLSTVTADDRAAMRQCVDHLVELGHRRIAHVCGTTAYLHTRRRLEVLDEALAADRLAEATVLATDFSETDAARCTVQLLEADAPPTAIIYDSDVMALAGLAAMQERQVMVPDDMSVISFDDSLLARVTHPPLTALSRNTFEFGALAGRTLAASLAADGRGVTAPAEAPTLSVRRSTAKPRRRRRPTRPPVRPHKETR